jgi:hypothetical protein
MRELIRFDERLPVLVSKDLSYLSHFKLYIIAHVISKSGTGR